ncbi:nitrate/nitrite transporter [Thioalkalicoccus limnaeus]|uniref:Nitrate/nitrite transporter n=1 Tax=Thioalkalicoccus limnaeus TaxID=120681 RepID=A0ABV4BH81_9GAMM
MSTTVMHEGPKLQFGRGRWIDNWNPENEAQWQSKGKGIARRNLAWSMFAEFLGFAMLAVWGMVVPRLLDVGFQYTVNQMFWLIAMPGLFGAFMRFAYTFAPPRFGGRNWTIASALLLLIPATGLAWAVTNPDTPYWLMLTIATTAGLGAGNFTSSMVNISFFYPEREKGFALGLNAAGGNLGTAWVQFTIPIVIITGAGLALDRAGLMFIPLIILAAMGAYFFMNNLSSAQSDSKALLMSTADKNTWIMSFLYIGTFGSFIGYANSFATLMRLEFPEVTTNYVFLGALIGATIRPLGGWMSDRYGGARMTLVCFAVMIFGCGGVIWVLFQDQPSFPLFLTMFLILFAAAGFGNGTTYRMIPAIFRAQVTDRQTGKVDPTGLVRARRLAGGCIGIAGAIGSLGAFIIPRVFGTFGIKGGFIVFIVAYIVMIITLWFFYERRGSALSFARV